MVTLLSPLQREVFWCGVGVTLLSPLQREVFWCGVGVSGDRVVSSPEGGVLVWSRCEW